MAASEGTSDGVGDEGRIRASAGDIYERVKREGRGDRSAGLGPGTLRPRRCVCRFGAVASAAATVALAGHHDARLVGAIFFPIGFIVVIIGRAQLFTENTLYPVTLVLDDRRHLFATLRLWIVVLGANLIGAALFAALLTKTAALLLTSPPRSPRTVTTRRMAAGRRSSGARCLGVGRSRWWPG